MQRPKNKWQVTTFKGLIDTAIKKAYRETELGALAPQANTLPTELSPSTRGHLLLGDLRSNSKEREK
jgi:hypothetical protein